MIVSNDNVFAIAAESEEHGDIYTQRKRPDLSARCRLPDRNGFIPTARKYMPAIGTEGYGCNGALILLKRPYLPARCHFPKCGA
jgi:hypothetical protein